MKIKIMSFEGDQTFTTYDCDDFEFRGNQVTNWIKLFKDGKEVGFVNRVCVIKTVSEVTREEYMKRLSDMQTDISAQPQDGDLIDRNWLTGRVFTEADLTDAHKCYDSIMAIIKSMPSVLKQTDTDFNNDTDNDAILNDSLISRQALIERLENLGWIDDDDHSDSNTNVLKDIIDELPSVHPKAGHWIRWYEQKETDWCIENTPHCKCS